MNTTLPLTTPLPVYAWPGGYPLAYQTPSGDIICPQCTTTEEQPETLTPFVHWEGEPLICEECNQFIEPAYDPLDS